MAGATTDSGLSKTQAARSVLTVRHISLRAHDDRITGTASIVNSGPVTVRTDDRRDRHPGCFWRSWNRTSHLRAPFADAGKFDDGPSSDPPGPRARSAHPRDTEQCSASTCIARSDDSQRARTAPIAGTLTLSTSASLRSSGPVPKTTLWSRHTTASTPSTTELHFGSTLRRSTFQCSLDGGPWLTCSSPRSYRALAYGPHAIAVRAISPGGKADPTPAGTSWVVLPASRPARRARARPTGAPRRRQAPASSQPALAMLRRAPQLRVPAQPCPAVPQPCPATPQPLLRHPAIIRRAQTPPGDTTTTTTPPAGNGAVRTRPRRLGMMVSIGRIVRVWVLVGRR